jgi:glycerol-3-phosphate cytidylyltransferase
MQPWKAYGRDEPFRHAYVGGTFDCLHRGHLALFANAKKIATHLTVSVNTDEFAARYKRRPLMPLADRLAVIKQCRLVDNVILNEGDEDSRIAIEWANTVTFPVPGVTLGPKRPWPVDVIVHGDDWTGESYMQQLGVTQEWLDERSIQIVYLPYTGIVNTTQLQKTWMLSRFDRRPCPECESILVSDAVRLHHFCVKCGHVWSVDERK